MLSPQETQAKDNERISSRYYTYYKKEYNYNKIPIMMMIYIVKVVLYVGDGEFGDADVVDVGTSFRSLSTAFIFTFKLLAVLIRNKHPSCFIL